MEKQRRSNTVLDAMAAAGLLGCFAFGSLGCKSKSVSAPIVGVTSTPDGADPAAANSAPLYTGGTAGGYTVTSASKTRVLGQGSAYPGQSSTENYGQPDAPGYGQQPYSDGGAPIVNQPPNAAFYDQNAPGNAGNGQEGYSDAEAAGAEAIADTEQAPPPLPEYDQPPAPEPNDLWTPGYWNYAPTGYYWVPGAWCAPPFYGALWTPPWWGFYGGHYLFHRGYWGSHVGYYGGVNYGFGYIGTGYYGGYWRDRDFYYNRAVTNVNVRNIHNVYDRRVEYNGREYGPHPDNRVSYNGGRGGINLQPRPFELAAAREPHYAPVAAQSNLRLAAAGNRSQFFAANGGRPAQAFAPHAVGNAGAIAAIPQGQPFNSRERSNDFHGGEGRPGVSGQLLPNGTRPGTSNFSGATQPGNAARGFTPQQPGTPGQVYNNHQFPGGRPEANGNRPEANGYRQGNGGQVITPQQPGTPAQVYNNHQFPGGNRPENNGYRPETNGYRQGTGGQVVTPQQPGTPAQVYNNRQFPGGNRPETNGYRQGNGGQVVTPQQPGTPAQVYNNHQPPAAYNQRPEAQGTRPVAPQGTFQQQRPSSPFGQPRPNEPAQQEQGRPSFGQARPTPQGEQGRPAPSFQPHAAPAPAPRPQAAPSPAPRPAAPAAAPHGGGGEEHGHH